jgi:hypothetical protein
VYGVQNNERDTGKRHTTFRHLGGELRCAAVQRHRAQDATGGVQAGVQTGQRGGQHDEVHDVARGGNADAGEEGDERAGALFVGGVGQQQGEQDQRADVEDRDAQDHRVDGLWHDLLRIGGLAGGSAHQFDCGIGEDDAGRDDHQLQYSGWQDAAVVGDDGYAGVLPLDGEPACEEHDADYQEGDQCDDLDQRGPELHFAKHLDRDHVHGQRDHEGDQRDGPLRNRAERAPVVHVQRDGGHVDDRRARPVEEVHPARDVSRLLAEEFACVGHERSRRWTVQDQFAERAEDEEDEDAADAVDDEQAWPRGVQPTACTHEQPGADGPADGNHLQLPGFQALVVTLFLVCQC